MDRGPGVLGRPRTPGGANCPPHTPALAGHPRQPQAIAQRRAFRKAACWFCAAGRALVPPAAMQEGVADALKVFGGGGQHTSIASAREARRTAPPPASTTHHGSHSPFVGDTPSRAGPRLPGPFGRSRLSAGEAQSPAPQRRAPLAVSEPPRVIRETTKGELKHARSKCMNNGRKKEKKKKNQINNKKKTGGQNGKVNACASVNCSLQEPPALARDLVGLSEKKKDRGEMA